MKVIVLRSLTVLLVFAVTVSVGAGVSSAQYGQAPQSTPDMKAPAQGGAEKPATPPAPINKKEEAAYKAFYAARTGNPAAQVQLGEDFIKKYPQSHYLSGIYAQLCTAYFSLNQEDKMFEYGNKAIELDPDNVSVLALFAWAMPRRVKSTTPDAAQQIQKAESYGRRVLELVPTLPKPEGLDDASFEKAKKEELSMAYSGLGLIDYQHKKFEDARVELTQAVQLSTNPDPVDYFLLGGADMQTSYYNDAIASYGKCAESGPLADRCKAGVELAKKDAATKLGR
jgi:tetratricopeptide (TPR) repeat protein